jgi:hypothetical protein
MRRYDDPVEVRKGMVGSLEAPEQFLWRGKLWKVRDVLAHWVETGPWWQSSGVRAVVGSDDVPADRTRADHPRADHTWTDDAFAVQGSPVVSHDLLAEREMWRVEAGTGMTNAGVFDLSFSWTDGHWQLVGCAD